MRLNGRGTRSQIVSLQLVYVGNPPAYLFGGLVACLCGLGTLVALVIRADFITALLDVQTNQSHTSCPQKGLDDVHTCEPDFRLRSCSHYNFPLSSSSSLSSAPSSPSSVRIHGRLSLPCPSYRITQFHIRPSCAPPPLTSSRDLYVPPLLPPIPTPLSFCALL
jgi:hypothetical protein